MTQNHLKHMTPEKLESTDSSKKDSSKSDTGKTDTGETGTGKTGKTPLVYRPELYLVYLLFYFVPWVFRLPTTTDVLVTIIALVIFLPVYFRSFSKGTVDYIPYIILIEMIGFATMPFHGMSGTFHIFATCHSAYQDNRRRAIILITALTLIWIIFSIMMQRHPIEIGLVCFIGIISAIGCMAGVEQRDIGEKIKRSRVLDTQLAAIAERERIARDLHDLLGHTLTMVAVKSQVVEKFIEQDPERAKQELREIYNASRTALRDVRKTVSGMVETRLDQEIELAREALQAADITFKINGSLPTLSNHASSAAGFALREAVTNIIRHSQAANAELTISYEKHRLILKVSDNGTGQITKDGAGLTGLRQRIAMIGGDVKHISDKGTQLIMKLPLSVLSDTEILPEALS